MPPVVMTKVIATATIISGAIWRTMLRRFGWVRKVSVTSEKHDRHDDQKERDAGHGAVLAETTAESRAGPVVGADGRRLHRLGHGRASGRRPADRDWNLRPTMRLTTSSMLVSPISRSATRRPS